MQLAYPVLFITLWRPDFHMEYFAAIWWTWINIFIVEVCWDKFCQLFHLWKVFIFHLAFWKISLGKGFWVKELPVGHLKFFHSSPMLFYFPKTLILDNLYGSIFNPLIFSYVISNLPLISPSIFFNSGSKVFNSKSLIRIS